MNESAYALKPARKAFSRIGLAFCAILVVATVTQLLWIIVPTLLWGEDNWFLTSSWGFWISSFAPLYGIAIPVGLLIMRKLPAQPPQDNKPRFTIFLVLFPICFLMMFVGSLLGNILSALFSGGTAENPVTDYVMDQNPLKVVVIVILAPVLEEYVCRKQIIDRVGQYGEKTAMILSALIFGLLHQNLFQFFYAFGIGLVLGYLYIRTGRLRYPIIFHGIINFMGSVIAPWILTLVNEEALANLDPNLPTEQLIALYREILPGLLISMAYTFFYLGLAIAGLVLLIVMWRRREFRKTSAQLPKNTVVKTVYLNVGMVLYVLLCIGAFVLALL